MKNNQPKTRDQIGGGKPGPGRKSGVPNKVTGEVRAMILAALDAMGGQAYLERVAEANPVAFMALLAKLIPSELKAEVAQAPALPFTPSQLRRVADEMEASME